MMVTKIMLNSHTLKGDYMEQWKEVEGTDGKIMVSNYGRVKSLLRDGRVLKATPDKKGYLRLRITLKRKKIVYKVHRIVAKAFIPNPNNLPQVNHKNGDKTDNRVENLEWVSNRENAIHARDTGLWETVIRGVREENRKRMRPVIGKYKDGKERRFASISEAERYIGSRHICDVLKGKRRHVKGWTFLHEGVMQ